MPPSRGTLLVALLGGCYLNVGETVPDAGPTGDDEDADAGIDADLGPPVTLYVDGDTLQPEQDGSEERPFKRIQAAVDAAKTGDTILVRKGTYFENIVIEEKAVELRAVDSVPANTTLRAREPGAVISLISAGPTIVAGFRITGGSGFFDGDRYEGGGIYALDGAPEIRDNLIEGNDIRHGPAAELLTRGGGIAISGGAATIVGNVIRNNRAGRGAGLAAAGPTLEIRGNVIEGNEGNSDHGGGVFLASPSIDFVGNQVLGNAVGRDLGFGWGGGIYLHDTGTVARLEGNLIRGNFAPTLGSGVFIDNEAEAWLFHDLIAANVCPERGGAAVYVDGIDDLGSAVALDHVTIASHDCPTVDGGNAVYVEGHSRAMIKNSVVWGNGDDFFASSDSTLQARYTLSAEPIPGLGNLSVDPRFADPAAGDYHVRSRFGRWDPRLGMWVTDAEHSPAIDAADPIVDFSHELSPNGGRANLGADGNSLEASLSMD
jgi:hypothetical protein